MAASEEAAIERRRRYVRNLAVVTVAVITTAITPGIT
jgi:hypothetical protein